ncbi:MAG: nickel-binding protein [Actinomycetota bacterium]
MSDRRTVSSSEPAARRYVVEVEMMGGYPDVHELSARVRAAAGAMQVAGTNVRFVRTVFVPEDGACLLVFEATSEQAALEATAAAGLGVAQVSPALTAKEQ